jgi:hypothetical protein
MNRELISTKELKTEYWRATIEEGRANLQIYYEKQVDALSFFIADQGKERIIVHYVDRLVALLYRYSDKEIVGLRVDAFKKRFLPRYSELEKVWKLSDSGIDIQDFGDLEIAARKRVGPVAREIYRAADPIVEKKGLKLEPVPA